MKKQISVANLVMLAGGAVTFLFSWFTFIGFGDFGESAWGSGNFPLATIPAILGLAMIVVGILDLIGKDLPGEVLTFNWKQIKFTWGVVATTIMIAFLILDKGSGSLKFGGIMMLLGSIAMAAGATMGILGKGTDLVNIPDIGSNSPKPSGGTPPPPPPPPPPPSV
ncbi:MAG: hypothetical protein AB7N61_00625 [Acidimicrobiia bacterium]